MLSVYLLEDGMKLPRHEECYVSILNTNVKVSSAV